MIIIQVDNHFSMVFISKAWTINADLIMIKEECITDFLGLKYSYIIY